LERIVEQRLHLQQRQVQRLIMTPKMQQSIQLLQMSTLELASLLQKELVENPLLEESPSMEVPVDEQGNGTLQEGTPSQAEKNSTDDRNLEKLDFDSNWEDYFADASDAGADTYIHTGNTSEPEIETPEAPLTYTKTLQEHLVNQLELTTADPKERAIGMLIIDGLDNDGYLKTPLEQIAEMTETSVKDVERFLAVVQTFDPVGIAARDLAECLEIQCLYSGSSDPLVLEVIRYHLGDLERRRFSKMARVLGVPEKQVQDVADQISRLEPKPGRKFSVIENEYVSPDVFVEKIDGDYRVRVNDDSAPPLRISKRYRRMLQERENLPSETYEFIKNKYKSAMWLIRNIEQRKRTLYNVTQQIVKMQRDFLENGISHLKPMRLRDVADAIGVHEATVCRVVNGKYVQTPRGLFELKYFFSTALENQGGGEDRSSKSVMEMIRGIIDEEDSRKPYSDQKIANILKSRGVNIARRTVSKYREKMGILSTSARKRV
jgi:RNA polymerase sigma-54 factor